MAVPRRAPTKEEVVGFLTQKRNWGRWGARAAAGTINLITPEKRVAAARLVKNGRTVSLSRPFPVTASPENPSPALHYMKEARNPTGMAYALDFIGIAYHGYATTHIDAICHVYTPDGYLFDGREAKKEVSFQGATFGAVDAWASGIMTRGVLLDIPKLRGKPYATYQEPVHGWELEDAAKAEGVKLEPGDAVMVYSGREAFSKAVGPWGAQPQKPGLHASCLPFLRDNDVAVLGWDMLDQSPNEYGLPTTIHGAIHAYGLALLDNALLEPLARACAEERRYEFLLTINPLHVVGGTGSPVNPVATF